MMFEPNGRAATAGSVLVVEDDRSIRALLRDFLQEEGYSVRDARDGQTALDFLRQTTESWVILLDHLMPRLDGPGLIASIQADPVLRGRHAVIYMTAGDRILDPTLQQLLESLQICVLRKPFSLTACLDAIAAAAERLTVMVRPGGEARTRE